MKHDTEAALKDLAAKVEAAFLAARRACAALGEDDAFWEPEAAKLIDPDLAGGLALANALAILMLERVNMVSRTVFAAGAQNGPAWRDEVAGDVAARCARLDEGCSCGRCARCQAAQDAVRRAMEIVNGAHR
ncbi:hypothetical protein WME76_02170 [Sorangium sp. So ce119]|uniref:hypothetical protein n=1 Tax=Sorangium sp. So ce119 TaxID=3133279 RepID=UPI003F638BE1